MKSSHQEPKDGVGVERPGGLLGDTFDVNLALSNVNEFEHIAYGPTFPVVTTLTAAAGGGGWSQRVR
jgi:hypothetical protein